MPGSELGHCTKYSAGRLCRFISAATVFKYLDHHHFHLYSVVAKLGQYSTRDQPRGLVVRVSDY